MDENNIKKTHLTSTEYILKSLSQILKDKDTFIVSSDQELESKKQRKLRSLFYTHFLEVFSEDVEKKLSDKKNFKKVFFWVSIIILIICGIVIPITSICLFIFSKMNTLNIIVVFTNAVVTLVTALLVIPKKIAEYYLTNQKMIR